MKPLRISIAHVRIWAFSASLLGAAGASSSGCAVTSFNVGTETKVTSSTGLTTTTSTRRTLAGQGAGTTTSTSTTSTSYVPPRTGILER